MVVNRGNPFANYRFVNGGWINESPCFEGTLEECKQWILAENRKHGYRVKEYDIWLSSKWYEDKAELDEDTRSWDFHGW